MNQFFYRVYAKKKFKKNYSTYLNLVFPKKVFEVTLFYGTNLESNTGTGIYSCFFYSEQKTIK